MEGTEGSYFTNALTGGLWGSNMRQPGPRENKVQGPYTRRSGRQVIYSQITKVNSTKSALRFVRTLRVGRRGRPMKRTGPDLLSLVIHNHSPERHFWSPMGDTGEGPDQ